MSYLTQSIMAGDSTLHQRVIACCVMEGVQNPEQWVSENRWILSAQAGWDAAYASALATYDNWDGTSEEPRPPIPGANEAAITDYMILAAVQHLTTPPEPEPEEPEVMSEPEKIHLTGLTPSEPTQGEE